MTKDKCDVKLEINDWMLAKVFDARRHFLGHRCQDNDHNTYRPAVYFNDFSTRARHPSGRWACAWCSAAPPEELIGLYLLLETDYAYAVMQKYLNYV
jgi:hypothetical protein